MSIVNGKNINYLAEEKGFGLFEKETDKRISFNLSSVYVKSKHVWGTVGDAKKAFKYHTGIFFDEQNEYEIRAIV